MRKLEATRAAVQKEHDEILVEKVPTQINLVQPMP